MLVMEMVNHVANLETVTITTLAHKICALSSTLPLLLAKTFPSIVRLPAFAKQLNALSALVVASKQTLPAPMMVTNVPLNNAHQVKVAALPLKRFVMMEKACAPLKAVPPPLVTVFSPLLAVMIRTIVPPTHAALLLVANTLPLCVTITTLAQPILVRLQQDAFTPPLTVTTATHVPLTLALPPLVFVTMPPSTATIAMLARSTTVSKQLAATSLNRLTVTMETLVPSIHARPPQDANTLLLVVMMPTLVPQTHAVPLLVANM